MKYYANKNQTFIPRVDNNIFKKGAIIGGSMERQAGLEPVTIAWEATMLPLHYCRKKTAKSGLNCIMNRSVLSSD